MNRLQQLDKFNYVKLNTEKYQNNIEEGIKFLQSMINKKNNGLDIEVRDYLCLIYDIKLLEDKYLKLQTDFSDVMLKWSVRDKKDLDHMVLVVVGLRNQQNKPLSAFTIEEKQATNINDETWEQYLFIDNLVSLDKFQCITRDVERLSYIYNHNIGNIMISGLQTINSKNIEYLYIFLKQLGESLGLDSTVKSSKKEEIVEVETDHFNVANEIQNIQTNIQDIFVTVQEIQKNVNNIKQKVEDLEFKYENFNQQQDIEKSLNGSHNEMMTEFADRLNQIENKLFDIEQKLEESSMSNALIDNDVESMDIENYNERLNVIESQLLNLKEELLYNIEQKIYNVVQEVLSQNQNQQQIQQDSLQSKQLQTEQSIEENETETPIIVDEEIKEETNVIESKKKKTKFFNFKLFLIIWFVIFILFMVAILL